MKNTRVYDLPTRLFHWIFAGGFLGAFFIAKTIDDDSPLYSYHMLLGLILALVVGLRIIWGLVGSRYARFTSFPLKPTELVHYFKQIVGSKTERALGHNPASSWAAIMMMGLSLGLALTGYLMTSGGNKEVLEEVHELLANTFILVVLAHVGGILLHTLKHRDGIALSMIHGKKALIEGEAGKEESGIESSHRGIALLFLLIVGGFVFYLNQNYDPTSQKLTLLGSRLQLGEAEEETESENDQAAEQNEREENENDD